MAITLSIELNREIEIPGSFDEVFDLLADVPRSAKYFPKVDKLVDLGDNAFRWELEKVGVDKYALQSVYACVYRSDREAGKITWEPVSDVGNGVVSGSWTLSRKDDSTTQARFHTHADMSLPLPSMLKLAVSPVVKHEFNSMVDTYMANLKKAL